MVALTKTNNLFRTLFFITVPLLLIGATVIVIIISQGASVTNEGIVGNTGVIRINTDPADVKYDLYVDGALVENLNNKGANLDAGEHLIRIEATGMTTWEKTVAISKGVVNEVYVKLFPDNMDLKQLTSTNIQNSYITSTGDYIFYVVTGSNTASENGIWRMQLSENTLIFLDKTYSVAKISDLNKDMQAIITANNYTLLSSPDNTKVLLRDNASAHSFVVSTQSTNAVPQVIDLNNLIGFAPQNISWFNDSNTVLVQDKNALFTYNLNTKVATLVKYSPASEIIFGANPEQVIYFDDNSKTLRLFSTNNSTEITVKNTVLPTDIQAVYVPENSTRFCAIKTAVDYELIDLEKNTLTSMMPASYTLQGQSPDGLGYIFKTTEGALAAFTISENVGLDTLETQTKQLDFKLNDGDKLIYTTHSNYLLYFNKAENTLYTLDWDGTNKIVLIKDQIISGIFNYDINATNLIVMLQDGLPTDTSASNNLYRLSLTKSN